MVSRNGLHDSRAFENTDGEIGQQVGRAGPRNTEVSQNRFDARKHWVAPAVVANLAPAVRQHAIEAQKPAFVYQDIGLRRLAAHACLIPKAVRFWLAVAGLGRVAVFGFNLKLEAVVNVERLDPADSAFVNRLCHRLDVIAAAVVDIHQDHTAAENARPRQRFAASGPGAEVVKRLQCIVGGLRVPFGVAGVD